MRLFSVLLTGKARFALTNSAERSTLRQAEKEKGTGMKGTLIVNHDLHGEKFRAQTALYLAAAEKLGMTLTVRTNAEPFVSGADFVLFLAKDVRLARLLEQDGCRVFNSASSIALCDDKSLTYLRLREEGLPMPETLIAPMMFFAADWSHNPFVETAVQTLGFPMVVKEACGSFGQQVWLVKDRSELIERLNASASRTMLLQRFVASSYGRDIRVQVVGREVVASMYRWSETDFRANVSNGGSMKPYLPTEEQKALALQACDVLGLSFGGVDLLFGEGDEPLLCEVNSNAHIRNLLDCTGINVAEHILAYIRDTVMRT